MIKPGAHQISSYLPLIEGKKIGLVAHQALAQSQHGDEQNFYRGKLQAMRYFFSVELPHTERWSALLMQGEDSAYAMRDDWF